MSRAEEQGPRPPHDAEPSFDPAPLDGLKAILPAAKFAALAESLMEQLGTRVAHAIRLINDGQDAEARRAAHDIVAVAGSVGAMRLSAMARTLETGGKTGGPANDLGEAVCLDQEAESAFAQLRSYRAALRNQAS